MDIFIPYGLLGARLDKGTWLLVKRPEDSTDILTLKSHKIRVAVHALLLHLFSQPILKTTANFLNSGIAGDAACWVVCVSYS